MSRPTLSEETPMNSDLSPAGQRARVFELEAENARLREAMSSVAASLEMSSREAAEQEAKNALSALVARAEPASDVASLVQAAREFAGKAMRAADAYRETRRRELAEEREEVADLANRLAAALAAQAERLEKAVALNREAEATLQEALYDCTQLSRGR